MCRNITCAQGKWSLHSTWNFISTLTEFTWPWRRTLTNGVTSNAYFRWLTEWRQIRISADQRKWRQIRISAVSMQHWPVCPGRNWKRISQVLERNSKWQRSIEMQGCRRWNAASRRSTWPPGVEAKHRKPWCRHESCPTDASPPLPECPPFSGEPEQTQYCWPENTWRKRMNFTKC